MFAKNKIHSRYSGSRGCKKLVDLLPPSLVKSRGEIQFTVLIKEANYFSEEKKLIFKHSLFNSYTYRLNNGHPYSLDIADDKFIFKKCYFRKSLS